MKISRKQQHYGPERNGMIPVVIMQQLILNRKSGVWQQENYQRQKC